MTAKKVKSIVKTNVADKATFGTNPKDPWSTKSELGESAGLDKYLLSRGINPNFVSKDTKVAHSKSNLFKQWVRNHAMREDTVTPSPTMDRLRQIKKKEREGKVIHHQESTLGPRADKLLARSDSAFKAGDKETSSRAHKLFMRAKEKHLSNPDNAEKHRAHIMGGAGDYYKSKKPGQYVGDSVELEGNIVSETNVCTECNEDPCACSHGFVEGNLAEGLPQTLRKVVPGYAKREIDKKMDAGKFGKTDADKDANFQRYKKIQDKLKEQGVAEGDGDEAYVACIVQFNRSGRAMVQRTKPISHERAEEVIRNALAKNTFVHPPFMTIYPASAGKLDGSTIMAQFPDMSQKGVAEGQGNFDTAINNLHGWYEVDSSSPDIKEYEFDDREGGYYAQGTVKYSMSTGRVKIEFEDRSGQYGDDVNQTFNSIGDAMNVLRTITTQYRYNNGKAQKFDRLSHREPVTPDKLRKTDRTGRKGTISGAHSNDLKYSIQNNKGKLGPKGVLPEGQGVAEGLDKEPPDYAAMYENKLVEFAGGMGTGSVATAPGVGKGSNVGSLFGGSYSQKNSPFKKTKAKKESVIKR